MPVELGNPPIHEVIVALYFKSPLINFRSEHVGLFWQKIKHDFPTVQQQPPSMSPLPDAPDADGVFPMPRYWFISHDKISLIQIQNNAFILNWRRLGNNEYPRYHKRVKPAFDKYYSLFSKFIDEEVGIDPPAIDLCELTYVNTLYRCEFWAGTQDTAKVIPSFSTLDHGINASAPSTLNCNYSYKISDELHLGINILSGPGAEQQNDPFLRFTITARGRIGGETNTEPDEWFRRAHDSANECFVHMTSADIQKKYWAPKDIS